jgi:hypothetical protein
MGDRQRAQKLIMAGLVVGLLPVLGWVVWSLMGEGGPGAGKVGKPLELAGPATRSAVGAARPREDPNGPNWGGDVFTVSRPDGVVQTSGHSWSVKAGRSFMLGYRREDGTLGARFVQPFGEFLPAETNVLLKTRWQLGETAKVKEQIGMSERQWKQLQAISPDTEMPVSELDKHELMQLLEKYTSAVGEEKKAMGEKLVGDEARG